MNRSLIACLIGIAMSASGLLAQDGVKWVVYQGGEGPGHGKHVVLIGGDEEYRSEEYLPQLGKILAAHHGFKCTVLFSIDPKTGEINPDQSDNVPGTEALATADLMIIGSRFRDLPDDQMKPIVDYIESGKPIIGMRTATHAFNIKGQKTYSKYSFNSKADGYDGGFGRQVLGETWISHHGHHGQQSTLGLVAPGAEAHPILKGIKSGDVWGPTDVYGVRLPLPGDSQPLILGQILIGMSATDPPLEGAKNDPMMPVAWIKSYTTANGTKARVFNTTMGASQDLSSVGTRRLLVNAVYWCVGLENKIDPTSSVATVGDYQPTPFGFKKFTKGIMPSAHVWSK